MINIVNIYETGHALISDVSADYIADFCRNSFASLLIILIVEEDIAGTNAHDRNVMSYC